MGVISLSSHFTPAEGGRGNLPPFVIASPPKAGVAISSFVIARAPFREPVAISIRKRRDCFATARNDRKVASLLAMTVKGIVIASLPVGKAGQSNLTKENTLLKSDFKSKIFIEKKGGILCPNGRSS